MFSPNDPTTAGLALHYVRQALARWEPRIEILRLDAGTNDLEPWRLDIVLEYRLKATRRVEALVVPVDLAGEEG
jgi:phage baseplate assembly protein W